MKLTILYYLHKAGAGFPSPATDYIEEDKARQSYRNQNQYQIVKEQQL